MNDIPLNLTAMFNAYSRTLTQAFEDTQASIGLPPNRGRPRENALRTFLRDRLPKRYGVGEGYVINWQGVQSKQLDVVIYDANSCPKFAVDNDEENTLYPIEGVYAAIEVKSTLNKETLTESWDNAQQFKKVVSGDERTSGPHFVQSATIPVPRFYAVFAFRSEDWSSQSGDKCYIHLLTLKATTAEGAGFDLLCIHNEGVLTPTGVIGFVGQGTSKRPFYNFIHSGAMTP